MSLSILIHVQSFKREGEGLEGRCSVHELPCLLCKPEDLSLNSQHQSKRQGVWLVPVVLAVEGGAQRQIDLQLTG